MNVDLLRALAEHILLTEGRAVAGDAERLEAVTGGLVIARERIGGAGSMGLSIDYLNERVLAIVGGGGGEASVVCRAPDGVWQRALWDAAPGWQAAAKGGGVVRH